MTTRHAQPVRGLMSTAASPNFEGHFGRIFRFSDPATFGKHDDENIKNLAELGRAMSAKLDPPKDGKDEEESGIPALYTYFGQFVDHDITFDPASSLQQQNDPDALIDFRTPALDLDNVYGRGPADQPYLYDDGNTFLLGEKIEGGNDEAARDLPRNNANKRRALIGDPRNDENAIVSQLQGLFLRFHNRVVNENENKEFREIQRIVRYHYQYVVLNDFLARIVHSSVLDDLRTDGDYDREKLRFFHWREYPFMPIEFSVAAYRMGHSMIRPGYRLNQNVLRPILPIPNTDFDKGLNGFDAFDDGLAIEWGRFIDADEPPRSNDEANNRLQFAYRIDTSLVNPLSYLAPVVVKDGPPSLAERNLTRGWRLGLPSGQRVAEVMGVHVMSDEEIVIGKAIDNDPDKVNIADIAGGAFKHNCPLWTYILAEAMHFQEPVTIPVKEENVVVNTPKLGAVGGRIVAEVFLGLMFGDPSSYLSREPGWQPKKGEKTLPNYKLKDFVNYALGD